LSRRAAKKFIEQVEHVTFSGEYAAREGRQILYVTERCVFKLGGEGMELIEIAPGVDLEKDILAHVDFKPVIKGEPALMDARIFTDQIMKLKDGLISLPLEERLTYNAEQDLFFVNFEAFSITDSKMVTAVKEAVVKALQPVGHKVHTIVNYDNFYISPTVMDEYSDMVAWLVEHYYTKVTRYTTSAFLRRKLGEALARRNVSPHICECSEEARWELEKQKD
jgi:propionate CoA-transferase